MITKATDPFIEGLQDFSGPKIKSSENKNRHRNSIQSIKEKAAQDNSYADFTAEYRYFKDIISIPIIA